MILGLFRLTKKLQFSWLGWAFSFVLFSSVSTWAQGPVIDVWYGDTQKFGQIGNPNPYINVLGNVSDPDGISSLTYTLNGGAPIPLSIGPDTKRLEEAGDFNADILGSSLNVMPTTNSVEITAVDGLGNPTIRTVTVEYEDSNTWALPYSIDWSTVSSTDWSTGTSLGDVAQIADGSWYIDDTLVDTPYTAVRNLIPGYDRHLNVGDSSWVDYEVTAPITVHSFGTYFPYAGFQLRWNGNSDDPVAGYQPKSGWFPLGAAAWYNHQRGRLEIYNSEGVVAVTKPYTMTEGVEYMFKARVETPPGSDPLFHLKVWPSDQSEPGNWDLVTPGGPSVPPSGSLILVTVRADVSFGNVDVIEVLPEPVPDSILVSDDFSSGFDTSLWTFIDPQGDASFSLTGGNTSDAWLNIGVPGGVKHDAWTYGIQAPHILQAANDTNFEVDVKFESNVTTRAQIQGLLVKEDANNFIRFDFYHDNASTRIFAATIAGGTTDIPIDLSIADGPPLYMRVKRLGDLWILSYSYDGSTWTEAGSFIYIYNVSEVGIHCSNAGSSLPAHTASIDYFENTAEPLAEEDPVWVQGGAVTISNIQITTGETSATVTWNTDSPATSEVYFGETLFYEMGSEFDGVLKTSHSVVLSGLISDTEHHCRIVSENGSEEIGVSDDLVFTTDPPPILISNIAILVGDDEATVTWDTDVPSSSEVVYGETTAYELGSVSDSVLKTSHSLVILGLSPTTGYHAQIIADDGAGAVVASGNNPFTTKSLDTSGLVSDDFHTGFLEPSVWTYTDPQGDATLDFSGGNTSDAWLNIAVPAGTNHDPWSSGILAPHVLQAANNSDFEIEVKFESAIVSKAQIQGILVKQDASTFLRFDFYHSTSQTRVYAATISGTSANSVINTVITDGVPLFMRVKRTGNQWTQSYSYDGSTWIVSGVFNQTVSVTEVGLHSSNAGNNPAHTSSFDYFENLSDPLAVEDPVIVAGGAINISNIQINPDQNEATITWDTDVPANSQVLFGETLFYEMGTESKAPLVTSHSVTLTGLTGDTAYHCRIISDNGSGLQGISLDLTFTTDPPPIVISNIVATPGDNEASISWTTNIPSSSEVAYGETTGYELGTESESSLVTSHNIFLSGLNPNTTYHFQITADDGAGTVVSTGDLVFVTDSPDTSGIVSDDFSTGSLDPGVWTYVDPQGDATLSFSGGNTVDAWVNLSVPAGSSHDPWSSGILAPHIMQSANDTDFEVEIKFESAVTSKAQIQGFLVKQDANNFLRFDFYSNGSSTRIFAGYISAPSTSSLINVSIPDGTPMYMRVKREGNQWTQTYSYDGSSWLTGVSFSQALTVAEVGIHSSNAGSNPAHTTSVDYFVNLAQPLIVEDPLLTAGGSIVISNVSVTPGETEVTVTWDTNVPASSEIRVGETLSYELGIESSPALVTSHSLTFTGLFGDSPYHARIISEDGAGGEGVSEDLPFTTTPPPITISNVQIIPGEDVAVVSWMTDVPATSLVDFGETTAYELGSVSDVTLKTSHSLVLTGLLSQVAYHSRITVGDGGSTSVVSDDYEFTTVAPDASGIVSDDFSTGSLDPGVWTYVDPQGDATLSFSGGNTVDAWVNLSVPAGSSHDPWSSGILAPHIMQSANDTDFEVEIKFESAVTSKAQIQGFLFKQDANNFLRFDFYSNGSSTRIFAGYISAPSTSSLINVSIPDGTPLYMRVKREGNQWTQTYSYDGSSWLTGVSFSQALTVTEVGIHSSNAGSNPAHTTSVDYFVNLAQPLTVEDPVLSEGGNILISNIQIVPGETDATVTWTTNIPSSSEVLFGESQFYELGSESDPALATNHSVTLTGLNGDTLHHFRIISETSGGDIGISADQMFTTNPEPVFVVLSNIQIFPSQNQATLTWNTDVPATSEVAYGESSLYELGTETDGILKTSHSITLTGLSVDTLHHCRITSDNGSGGFAESDNLTFFTDPAPPPDTSGLESDDFSLGVLDPGIWTYVDPQGDATMSFTGGNTTNAWLNISVPAGSNHDPWNAGILAPHILQDSNDSDFEIEVKMESSVTAKAQIQGVLIKEDDNHFLRFDFYSNGSSTKIFAGIIEVPSANSVINSNISDGTPLYLRVKREGNVWTQSYSYDGVSWITAVSFNHAMVVNEVGLHSSNAGTNPAHTSSFDYFENIASPLVVEDPILVAGGDIVISNIVITPGETDATFTWDTDIASTGEVLYGESESYEGGMETDPAVSTSHSVTLTGLVGDTSYHARIINDDGGGQIGVSEDLPFSTTPPPLVISNIQIFPGDDEATISWNTDIPATTELAYGETTGYELGNEFDGALKTSHSVTLTGLSSDTTYHCQITADDLAGTVVVSEDLEFTTSPGDLSGLLSDDFSSGALDTGLWTLYDPQSDSTLVFSGFGTSDALLNLSVPAGSTHDPWSSGILAPHIMQSANDTDFEVEIKFESAVTSKAQIQGFLIKQDANNFLRFDFYSNGSSTRIFAGYISVPSTSSLINATIPDGTPMYMRVKREGNQWTQTYSYDGSSWLTGVSFSQALTVTEVGFHSSNAGFDPAHTTSVDYFENTASPIGIEDPVGP